MLRKEQSYHFAEVNIFLASLPDCVKPIKFQSFSSFFHLFLFAPSPLTPPPPGIFLHSSLNQHFMNMERPGLVLH